MFIDKTFTSHKTKTQLGQIKHQNLVLGVSLACCFPVTDLITNYSMHKWNLDVQYNLYEIQKK